MKTVKRLRPLLFAAALLSVCSTQAAPESPTIRTGSANISVGASTVINQSTPTLAIDWASFDVSATESVRFNQPSASSVALNRVTSGSPSSIFGRIDANGKIILVNSAGILFGKTAQVNTGAFVASTLELDETTLGSDRLRFSGNGAKVENAGALNGQEFVAVVAPSIDNSGTVRGGSVALAAGVEVIISTASGLFDVQVPVGAVTAAIENKGGVVATQGVAYLTARGVSAAASSLSNPGRVEATGLVERDGRIYLESEGALTTVGTVKATRAADGGDVEIKGGFVALGGAISADGAKGGAVKVESKGMLSLADQVTAKGLQTSGGSITYHSLGQTIENSTGFSDVSGRTDGGKISLNAEQGVMSSGTYLASGATGKGGMIDLTGFGVRLLSATLDASGLTQGGLIRVGGAFQGGKNLGIRGDNGDLLQSYVGRWSGVTDISNAQRTLVNDSSVLKVSATSGEGGTAIIWSDLQTTMVGKVFAGGSRGGVAEISSDDELRKASINQVVGARHILLDPKNIVVGTNADLGGWTYSAIIGKDYVGESRISLNTLPGLSLNLDNEDSFGTSVALNADASLFVVGASADSGASNSVANSGCVRLFILGNRNYSSAALKGVVGAGYVGGGNLDIQVESGDYFGSSVALSGDGRTMAVGAAFDDGYGNSLPGSGCVRIIRFADNAFNGGTVLYTIGHGYAGSVNQNWTYPLKADGVFGWSVALNTNATLMAIGSPGEADTNTTDRGNVRLFSLGDGSGSNAAYVASVVHDLFNGNSNGGLNSQDFFGCSVALNGVGDRMAIGAPGDDGGNEARPDAGVVRLYTFSDANFSNGTVAAFVGVSQYSSNDRWKVLNVNSIDSGDQFGWSVGLSADARTLAVGSRMDGYSGFGSPQGSVRLFRFADNSFNGGALVATLGVGYAGPNDVNLTKALIGSSNFGVSLALSADSTLLAVGSTWEEGSTGRVRLFSFQADTLSGGSEVFTIGLGLKASYSTPDASDYFGGALSFNAAGDRLAVGAPRDDGAIVIGDDVYNYGSVRLFTFSDGSFSGGALAGVIGKGYTGGRNVDVASLDAGDGFGSSVSLNAVGDRLAVGAPGDDGATYYGDGGYDYGNIRLFTFSDGSFAGGALAGVIGKEYTGGRNVDIAGYGGRINLDIGDLFGTAVSLNAAGDRLVVGAPGDDGSSGSGDGGSGFGNIRLFTFSDTSFNGGNFYGVIGKGYREGENTKQVIVNGLDSNDKFGSAVSLNAAGNRITVGAPGDDGATFYGDGGYDYGSVHLFAFAGTSFTDGGVNPDTGVVGKGYVGLRRADVANLDAGDGFGSSVSLNAAGDRLVVGAPGDDGATYVGSGSFDYGSVRLFSFLDGSFTGGALYGTLGKGYVGGQNVDIASLDAVDRFGSAVSFNASGDRLAVGSPGDDGATYVGSGSYEYGSVLLFRLGGVPPANDTFNSIPGTDSLINSTEVATVLASGTAVTIQANNDIIVASPINVGAGSTGTLSLLAGRSVRFDANVILGGRNLAVIANASAADGVIGAYRDAGQGGFSMVSGVSVQAGTFGVIVRGADTSISNPNSSPGSVTLGNLSVSSLGVGIYGLGLSGRTVSQLVGSSISVSGAVTIANQAGGIQLANSSNGSWAGLVTLAGVGDVQARVSGGLVLDDLIATSFDVRSTGALTASGDITLADAGIGMLSGTNVSLSGLAGLGSGADLRVNANDSITLAGFVPDLSAGAKLRLYACNDLTVSGSVVAAAGSLGEIRLTAGRDLKIDADLRLGGADLLARANAKVSDGIFGSFRPSGLGDFTMAAGTTLNADAVTVIIRGVDADGTNLNSAPGVAVFSNITSGSLNVSIEAGGAYGRSITQHAGSSITVAAEVVLGNQAGDISLAETGNGAWSGTTSLSASGSLAIRTASGLTIDALTAASFDVRTSGVVNVAGPVSLGASGYGFISSTSASFNGPIALAAASDMRVNASGSITLAGITPSLAAGSQLRFYGCNDVVVSAPLLAAAGSTGELRLTAGRDVKLNASVDLGAADLYARANAKVTDGIFGSYRSVGQGDFTMASGVSLKADVVSAIVRGVDADATNVNSLPGSIVLSGLEAGALAVFVESGGVAGRTISQNAGSSITVSGDVILGNQAGDISLAETGNGAWSGTTSLSASGSLAIRTASGLTIDALTAASFDVRTSGVVNVAGPVSLGASGYGFISSTSASFNGPIALAAASDMRVNASGSITLAGITPSLAAGSLLRFYGCNDIVVSAPLLAAAGSTGELRLTAGRDVKLNASVDLGGADLFARANAKVSDGIYGSYRPVGQGDFTMASGTSLEADSVTVVVRGVDADVTNVNSSPGGIVFADVDAGSLTLAIEGSGFTDRTINQFVGSGISVDGNASVANSLGNTILSSSLNGAWRGTTTLSSSGTTSLKVASSLTLGGLSASGFTVVSSGPMRVGGATALGSFGSSLLQAPGIDVAGSVSVGMFATLNAVSSREMRLTGASASMATGSSLRLWSTNLAIDTTNKIGYNYKLYGATYGVSNVTSTGIGWIYSLSSPYALSAPAALSNSAGMSLQGANYYRPVSPAYFGAYPLPSPLAPRSFELLFKSGELILPILSAPYQWDAVQDDESSNWLLDTKRDSVSTTLVPTR